MKLNLKCGQNIRAGYMNIDRFSGQIPPEVYQQGDVNSLDWVAEDGTVDEILALDCLQYSPTNTINDVLMNWAQKLIAGGTLKILVPDCFAIAKSFVQGQFNLQEFSQMILGTPGNNDSRQSIIDTNTLFDILISAGLTIALKRYEGVAIYVEAVKNDSN